MWEMATGYCLKTFLGHAEWVRMVTVHYSGDYFATCSNDETVMLWTMDSHSPVLELNGHNHVVECVAFAGESSAKVLHDTFTPEEEKSMREPLYLVSGSRDKKIVLWECWSQRVLLKITGHDNWIRDLKFHPNGTFLYSCSDDKSIRVWELATGRCKKRIADAHGHFVS
jgi:platelet-activating factor acetylhydrolase IB subunit alpha